MLDVLKSNYTLNICKTSQ